MTTSGKRTASQVGTAKPTRALTPAERGQRERAAVKTGLYVKAENGLQLRQRRVRRLVRKMQLAMPWLSEVDLPACRAWAELEILAATAFADLYQRGLTNAKGDPRRLLGDYRQLRQAQLAHERELGMTPLARAQLGVDLARLRAASGGEPASSEDVEALERRVMARLGAGEGDDA